MSPLFNLREGYLWAVAAMVTCTAVTWLTVGHFDQASRVMFYLLGVAAIAARFGRGPAVLSAIMSVLMFDFFFTQPQFSLFVDDPQDAVTFAVLLLVALLISRMMESIHQQARSAAHEKHRITSIYAMSSELVGIHDEKNVVRIAVKHVAVVFNAQAAVLLPNEAGRVLYPKEEGTAQSCHVSDLNLAQQVYDQGQTKGLGIDKQQGGLIYLALKAPSRMVGVLVLMPFNPSSIEQPEQQLLLANFTSQIALALERIWLATEAQNVQKKMEAEQLRYSMLSAISHDLRTPLSSILTASSILVDSNSKLNSQDRQELDQAIYEEALRMSGLTNNLLEIAVLETGSFALNRQWELLEDVVEDALAALPSRTVNDLISVKLANDLPQVEVDGSVLLKVFTNLLNNAMKYTPTGTPIEISAIREANELVVTVSDRGHGIPVGEEMRIFEKFYRAASAENQKGMGLGLTICRAIVEAHGGRIWADNLTSGGAAFHFTLPLTKSPIIEKEKVS